MEAKKLLASVPLYLLIAVTCLAVMLSMFFLGKASAGATAQPYKTPTPSPNMLTPTPSG